MRPAVNIGTLESASSTPIPTDVGHGFAIGVTESGPDVPTLENSVRNIDEYGTVYAPSGRTYLPGQVMYDAADEYYKQGGSALTVSRVTGAAAKAATIVVPDNAAAPVLNITVKGKGLWGNGLSAVVNVAAQNPDIPANNYRLQVVRKSDGAILEESGDLPDTASAMAWSLTSQYFDVKGGTSILIPVHGTYDGTTGADDIPGITNVQWQAAHDALGVDQGPGILMVPGATTDPIHKISAEHVRTHGRVAFLDGPDTPVAATLVASSKAVTDSIGRSRFCAVFAPWPITAEFGFKVPPSASVAGKFSGNMSAGISSNEPAAGENGILSNVLGFTQTYSDADRQLLNDNGVNVLRMVYGTPKVYGWRTTANPVADKKWIALSNSILHRQIIALANAVGERFIFRQIDGEGHLFSDFANALVAHVCGPLFDLGALFGNSPAEAFKVDTGPGVNTPTTIANNQIVANMHVRMAPFGEEVDIYIIKYLVTDTIPV